MVKSMPRGIISMRSSFLPLKKTITPLLISISIFSLVFSWSSLSSLTLIHYQNLHRFSINSFHYISIAMNKNCIFLIFNGILVFLAKTSSLLRPPSPDSDPDKLLHKRIVDELPEAETLSDKYITLGESFRSTENNVEEEEEEEEEDDDDDEETKTHELQEEIEVVEEETHELQEEMEEVVDEESNERAVDQVLISIEENDEDEDKEDSNGEEEVDGEYEDEDKEDSNGEEEEEEEEEEVDDEIEKLSDEELNKKFEDFIRRMKEEFKIDQYQQQQLVLVK